MIGLNNISDNLGANVKFKRVGRGVGSGKGKTSGRGMKGQKSRSGVSLHNFAGGQMPLYRRFAHIGFNNANFKVSYNIINLCDIQKAIDAKILGKDVNINTLKSSGLINNKKDSCGLKVLGFGKITTAISLETDKISKTAKKMIEDIGGNVVIKSLSRKNVDDKGRFNKTSSKKHSKE